MSTGTLPSLFGRATATLGEHKHLRDTMRLLEDSLPGFAGDSANEARFRELVECFSVELIGHFDAEESGSYFGTLITDSPGLAAAIGRLKSEHLEMRDSVERIRLLARGNGKGDEATRLLRDLFLRVQRHEQAENALLQEFFLHDEGGGPG